MKEVSELSHKDYKVTITKMLQQAITNILETILKNKVSANKQRYKGQPNGNFRTGQHNNQNLKTRYA